MEAGSSSQVQHVQNSLNPLDLPPIVTVGGPLKVTGNVMNFSKGHLKFWYERIVDFESLKANDFDVEGLFVNQGWKRYFEMLNGPIYTRLIKDFRMKSSVFDDVSAKLEVDQLILKDPSLKGKTRKEMGLKAYNGSEIRSVIRGQKISEYKNKTQYRDAVKNELFREDGLTGKSKTMKDKFVVLFKIFISSMIPRRGGTDTISWEHKHFLYFLEKGIKTNLLDLIFETLCQAIKDENLNRHTNVFYPRLLSELFFQTKLVKILRRFYKKLVEEERSPILDAGFLTRMHIKETLVKVKTPLKMKPEDYLYCNGFSVISEADDEEVIQFFLQSVKEDTNVEISRYQVPPAPKDIHKLKRRKAFDKEDKKVRKKDVRKEALKEAEPEPQGQKRGESKKRKSDEAGIGGSESRTKRKHDNNAEKDMSDSDDAHDEPIPGHTIPLNTILPGQEPIDISSTSTTDTAELLKEGDAIIQEGVAKFGEIPKSDSLARHLFEVPPIPNLNFLEKHLSPDPLNTQIFTHEQTQQQIAETSNQPEQMVNDEQQDIPQSSQPLNFDELFIS
ncbi:hypothetical protein A2U01_0001056 [Trifolium medium]|uniref:Cullin-like protein n=1 Tax=Trifolium medium TaxID=97028 RepID=A0A392LZ51_9FABA|nr:hypothetical protein [Trifolium medium]